MNDPTQLHISFHNEIYFINEVIHFFVCSSLHCEVWNGVGLEQFYSIFAFTLFSLLLHFEEKMEFYIGDALITQFVFRNRELSGSRRENEVSANILIRNRHKTKVPRSFTCFQTMLFHFWVIIWFFSIAIGPRLRRLAA